MYLDFARIRSIFYRSFFYVTLFSLFRYCFPREREVYFLLERWSFVYHYCLLILSTLWFLSLALILDHLVLFLLVFTGPWMVTTTIVVLVFFVPHIKVYFAFFFIYPSIFGCSFMLQAQRNCLRRLKWMHFAHRPL